MKKLINKVEDVVVESLEGMALAHPELVIKTNPHYMYARNLSKGKVALISGGGSGHEPLHGGFVGKGMLSAACPGEMFTSPTPDQMYEAAKAVDSGAGVLYIVKNYTGDVLNFETGLEMANADGIKVASILVDDDVAVKDSLYTAGRRGVGGTVIVEKIVGAAAEKGYSLEECQQLGKKVNQNTRSMGVALTSCTVPAAGKPTFDIDDTEIEMGVGIHGEPGQKRMKIQSADALTEYMFNEIFTDKAYSREIREWDIEANEWKKITLTNPPLKEGDKVIAFVNSLGGTPLSELYIVYRKLHELCEKNNITIARSLVGPYITSLEMQGMSITLTKADDELLELWDAPVTTPALKK
ncbi:MAG: dihydroxyacetone kinase subunit DhaK [Capnocytophaga sp.]|nr:dihydroxyacetone kinase subunit DhaK [Capnocytophaga sp.]